MSNFTLMPPRIAFSAVILLAFAFGCFVGRAANGRDSAISSETVLEAQRSVVGETIRYPTSAPAQITAKVITLAPGTNTVWHTHPMPTFGFVLDGEVTVDYGPLGTKTFKKGDALMEAMRHVHRGGNRSDKPVRILAVSIGEEGQPTAIAERR